MEAAAATDGDNISLRVSSFACYLDEAKENSVQKVSAEETLNHTKGEIFVFNVPKPIKDPIAKFSFSHEAPQKDEISVFGADKYFNTKLKYQYHHNKGRPVNVDRAGPNTGPTNGSSQSKQRKGIIGNILLSRYGWKGPCFNKKDVHVNEIVHRVSKPNRTGSERINHHALDENSTLEEPRDSIEVLGSGITSKGDVAVNMERKLALLTWDAIPKFNENRPTTTCDDMASEADSDLFEIESISRSVYPILAAATTTTAT